MHKPYTPNSFLRTSRCLNKDTLCKFQFGICIGREDNRVEDAWYLILHNAFHNGHVPEPPNVRKPLRLHSTEELHMVRTAMNIFAGEGVGDENMLNGGLF